MIVLNEISGEVKSSREASQEEINKISTKYTKAIVAINSNKQFPKVIQCRYIEPGLVAYKEFGTILIRQTALDKMRNTFIGKPVVDSQHKDVSPDNFRELADGVVIRCWNGGDGWEWCEMMLWSEEAINHALSGKFKVSCAYEPNEIGPGGIHNNIPYDYEFLNGSYSHLALVTDPRYEDANILPTVLNSKGIIKSNGGDMGIFGKGKTEQKPEEKKEEVLNSGEKYVISNGEKYLLSDLVKAWNAEEERKKKEEEEAKNAISDDAEIEIEKEGKKEKVPVKNMIEIMNRIKTAQTHPDKGVVVKTNPKFGFGREGNEQTEEITEDNADRGPAAEELEVKNSKTGIDHIAVFDRLVKNTNPKEMPIFNQKEERIKQGKKRFGGDASSPARPFNPSIYGGR